MVNWRKFILILIFILLFFVSGNKFTGKFFYSENENFNFPQNKNTLCIYNSNSDISREICEYYNETRYNYSVDLTNLGKYSEPQEINLYGLDINNSKFLTQAAEGWGDRGARFNVYREDFLYEDFVEEIYNPFLQWIEENPEKNITHIAIAKDLPLRIRTGETIHDVRSMAGFISSPFGESNENIPFPQRFNPDNFENLTYAVSYLTGYTLEDIKMLIKKAVSPMDENLAWLIDRDVEMTEINSVEESNKYTGGRKFSFEGVNYTLKFHSIFGILDKPILEKNIHLSPINNSFPTYGTMVSEESGRDYIFNISARMANVTQGDIYLIGGHECISIHTIVHPGFYSVSGPTTSFIFNCPEAIDFPQEGTMLKVSGEWNDTYQYLSSYLIPDTLNFSRTYHDYGFSLNYKDTLEFSLISNKMGNFLGESFVENTNGFISIPSEKNVIMFMNPGVYHEGYPELWPLKDFNFNLSNGSVIGSMESFNGLTFSGNETEKYYGNTGQGKIADAFTENAFGGENYSRSASGGFAHVSEPGLIVHRLYNFLECYKAGLTLGECYLMMPSKDIRKDTQYDGRVIMVGDPLMNLAEKTDRKIFGESCSIDSDCLSGNCKDNILGEKKCHYNDSSCSALGDLTNPLEFVSDGLIWCTGEDTYKTCLEGEWSENTNVREGYYCKITIDIYSTNSSISNRNLRGALCEKDTDCHFSGYDFYCSEDLEGTKRCHTIKDSCIVNEDGLEIHNGEYYCTSPTTRIKCVNETFQQEEETCKEYCVGGICKEKNSINLTISLIPDRINYVTLPIKTFSNNLNNLFAEFFSMEDFGEGKIYFFNSTKQQYDYYEAMFGLEEPFEQYNGLWSREGVTFLFSGGSIPPVFLEPGEGIAVKMSSNIENITFEGVPYFKPIEIKILGNNSLVSMPVCYQNYTASKWLSELQLIDPTCTRISRYNSINEVFEAYNQTPETDFQLNGYESYFISCSDSTEFNWTPSCEVCSYSPQKEYCHELKLNEYLLKEKMPGLNLTINGTMRDNFNGSFLEEYRFKLELDNVTIEFNHDFSSGELSLDELFIKRGILNNHNYVIVSNLTLNSTKNITIPKLDNFSNAICFLDREVLDESEIMKGCTNLKCPGRLGNIECQVFEEKIVISGLSHSAVIESYLFCGDQICDSDESCSSCSADCGSCPSGRDSGGSFKEKAIPSKEEKSNNSNGSLEVGNSSFFEEIIKLDFPEKSSSETNSSIKQSLFWIILLLLIFVILTIFIFVIRRFFVKIKKEKSNSLLDTIYPPYQKNN